MEMPDSEKAVEYTPDTDLRNEFHTQRTQYLMVRRLRDTGAILDVSHTNNVASASFWLKYEQKPVFTWKDSLTGDIRLEDVKKTVKDVFEISMG